MELFPKVNCLVQSRTRIWTRSLSSLLSRCHRSPQQSHLRVDASAQATERVFVPVRRGGVSWGTAWRGQPACLLTWFATVLILSLAEATLLMKPHSPLIHGHNVRLAAIRVTRPTGSEEAHTVRRLLKQYWPPAVSWFRKLVKDLYCF